MDGKRFAEAGAAPSLWRPAATLLRSQAHSHLPAVPLLLKIPTGTYTAQSGAREQLSLPGAVSSETEA